VGTPWNLAACVLVGMWLMLTRLSVGAQGELTNADHLIGALAITIAVTALAEVWRPVRNLRNQYGNWNRLIV
jgi:hypothetical protein